MRGSLKIFVLATLAMIIFSGCSKDDKNDTPDPVVKTNKELLTAKTWQVGETYQNITGTRIHYLRGGENTTGADIGKLRIKFNTDGTGSYTDEAGNNYTMTWAFTSADESNIHITLQGNIIFDWYFVGIEDSVLLASTNVATNGLLSSKWIPVP